MSSILDTEDNKMNNTNKIIITASVIIIFVLTVAIIAFMYLSVKDGKKKKINNTIEENKTIQEENDFVEEQPVSNEKVIDDSSKTLNKMYGKIEIVWLDKSNNMINHPLKPALGDGLIPVKYNSNNSQFKSTSENDSDWYDYSNSKWANAIDEKESYFVWIPRYAYKITYYSDGNFNRKIGYSDSRGILAINDDGSLTRIEKNNEGLKSVGNHYIVHPAFMKDLASGYQNGGWNKDISGFWMSKYEINNEEDSISSKPCKTAYRNVSIVDAYDKTYNYNRNMESHLTKNSEWGAAAYLSYSNMGTDTVGVEINNSNGYLTGGSKSENEVYNVMKNTSTTRNATGIYDMVGCSSEYVSACLETPQINTNTKYRTIISKTSNLLFRGNAMIETSENEDGSNSWNKNSSYFVREELPYLLRGGNFASIGTAGLFDYNCTNGNANVAQSFRVVLVNK